MAINVTTTSEKVTAAVSEDKVTATVSGASPVSATVTAGFGATGPQGPSGVVNVTAPITNAGTTSAADIGISLGEGLSVSSGSLRVTPGTYATLVGGTVPSAQLPSYVDDVLEFANVASLPVTGELGKIYVALNTGKIYRWSGSAYFEISTPPANTDAVPEGSSNLYFTNARARNSFGTGTTGQVVAWSGSEWTAGTVAIASVTGLQTALDGKAASSHNHDASAINAGTLAADRLPLASANTRGAVRIGSGISIDGDGVISASGGGGGGGYDQSLNKADSPTFAGLTLTGTTSGISYGDLNDQPTIFSGKYEDLSGAPVLSKVATSNLYTDLDSLPVLFSGNYDDLIGLPTLFSGNYNDLTNLPNLFDGEYSSLNGLPTFAKVASTNSYDDLDDKPALATVATTGLYVDLSGTPTLGTAAAQDSTAFAAASHSHAASDLTSGTLDAARLPLATTTTAGAVIVGTGLGVSSGTVSVTYGTSSGTACQGNDARLSDSRTPLSHTHAPADITFAATDRLLGRSTTGGGAGEEITCTSFGRSLIDDADAATARTTLGLGSVATLSNVSRLVQQSISATTVNNTTAESNLLSFSQTAVADNCVYRIHAFGTILNNTGGAVTYTHRFKIGATTVLATSAISIGSSAQRRRWRAIFDIVMAGGRAAQIVSAQFLAADASSLNWTTLQAAGSLVAYNTATEDMATAKTVAYTVQMGTANASAEMVCNGFYVEEIVT